ncbi:head-tail connector protein [Propionispora sp. 2/2-37]|uniref:head-tail connector protein n=1 Tax=Propionispora sp. 2/2-37 TaxID=1677858 RepID=UPI0006BB632F|nr:head-tail connector protein [Propionispora sp. 2/2-37]
MAEVLTLTEIKEYLRIDGEEENSLLTALYAAAKEHCENYLQAPLPSEVPMPVKQALLILIAHFYEQRTGEDIPKVVYALLTPYRESRW